jgi:peptidyl-prolyl cis-trans isomerase A (cyclophilin A)
MWLARIFLAVGIVALLGAADRPAKPVDVAIQTTLGTIVVRLDTAKAPITAGNFLKHVDAHVYDDASFYRASRSDDPAHPARIQIIQGGIEPKRDMFPPIAVETTDKTGSHNVAGTIAMARTGDPVSATSEFFINLGDDTPLDSDKFPDHFGYAVFGTVVKGYDIAVRIQHANLVGEALTPPIKIIRVRRL